MMEYNLEQAIVQVPMDLNAVSYLQEFLQKAYQQKLLSDFELEDIRFRNYELLTNQLKRFTCCGSSSVPEETAFGIQQSMLYTIGVYLKSLPRSDQRIDALKEKSLEALHREGRIIIERKIYSARTLLQSIQKGNFTTRNIAYNDTVFYGIPKFFSSYDVDYSAHNASGSIDYPLTNDPMELTGVEYVLGYLRKLSMENTFCSRFTLNDIDSLLRSYDENNTELLINIFGLVLTNAIGSVLSEKIGISLLLGPDDIRLMIRKLSGVSKEELNAQLLRAADLVILKLNIRESSLQGHIRETAESLTPRILNALENNCLETVFLPMKETNLRMGAEYKDGLKLNGDAFRHIVEEILECRYASDKLTIIKREILSISDFVDVLEGDCIFEDEFFNIYQSLSSIELALLINKSGCFFSDHEEYEINNEKEWKKKLLLYLEQTGADRKKELMAQARLIHFQDRHDPDAF